MSKFTDKLDRIKQDVRDRIALQKAQTTYVRSPHKVADLVSEYVVEGKTIEEWDIHVERQIEGAPDRLWIDLTTVPAWAMWCVERWRARGRPSRLSVLKKQVQELRQKGEELVRFAALDTEAARRYRELGDHVEAKKKDKQAEKKRKKSEELLAEATALVKSHAEKP